MNTYTVYKHTSPSGKVYIGITRREPEKRWDNGKGYKHSPHMAAAVKKYGWENIRHEILARDLTREAAEQMEVELIRHYRAADRRYGYNTDKGGTAPGRMAEETKRKLAAHMKGDLNPTRRFGHPFKGKQHSEESRLKMSAAAKARTGRTLSASTRQKLREAQAKRPVLCIETGVRYESIHSAAEATRLEATKICAVCKGKRKTTGGCRWEYVKEGAAV